MILRRLTPCFRQTSLAAAARDLRFCRPEIAEDAALHIEGGRHPVVEAITEEGAYIANDADVEALFNQVLTDKLIANGPDHFAHAYLFCPPGRLCSHQVHEIDNGQQQDQNGNNR